MTAPQKAKGGGMEASMWAEGHRGRNQQLPRVTPRPPMITKLISIGDVGKPVSGEKQEPASRSNTPQSEVLKLLEGLDMGTPSKDEQKKERSQKSAIPPVPARTPAGILSFSPVVSIHEELPTVSTTREKATVHVPQKENKPPTLDERPGFVKAIREMQARARTEATSPHLAEREAQQTKSILSPISSEAVLVKLPRTHEGPPLDAVVEDSKEPEGTNPPKSKTKSQAEFDAKIKTFLTRGAKKYERLQSQDPRIMALTPAEAWRKGLVGETAQSVLTVSSLLGEHEEGSRGATAADKAQRDYQIQMDAQHAARLQAEEDRAAAVAQTLMTLDDHEIPKARAAGPEKEAESENKVPFQPSEKTLRFWANEPGITSGSGPQQLTCNLCFNKHQRFYDSFDALQAHKSYRHKSYCIQCDIDFYDDDEYIAHKISSEEHIICKICHTDFDVKEALIEHLRLMHRKPATNLKCFGCNCPFPAGASVIYHIESSHCPNISPEQLTKLRRLMSKCQVNGKAIETQKGSLASRMEKMARLSYYLLGEDVYKEALSKRRSPEENPFDSRFDVGRYWSQAAARFECPYGGCTMASETKPSFVAHVQNKHFRQLTCPCCNATFATASAVLSHLESFSKECKVEETDLCADSIRMLSGGLLKLDGFDEEDGSPRIISARPPDPEMLRRA